MTLWNTVLKIGRPQALRTSAVDRVWPTPTGAAADARHRAPTLIWTASRAALSVLRWLEQKRTQQVASRRMHVAETLSLGEKRFVHILQVDGAQFLIGGTATNVQLLAILEKDRDSLTPPCASTTKEEL